MEVTLFPTTNSKPIERGCIRTCIGSLLIFIIISKRTS
nr:MAG TPA: hypothetical protein [Caudoviricetes sp.]DAE61603.1 MAG TPA: hypothetical protein [Caudoviricetes sp.]